MCLLVDKRLAFQTATTVVDTDSQAVSAWVGEWFVCAYYAPPTTEADAQVQAATAVQNIFETHRVHNGVP